MRFGCYTATDFGARRRRLNLVDQPNFLEVAGPALQHLNYAAVAPGDALEMCGPIDWFKMAQLTGLTKLEITDYRHGAGGRPLFPVLVELVLVRCLGIDQHVFQPGALMNLEKLHIEDTSSPRYLEAASEDPKTLLVEKLYGTGSVILGLSKLRQISGGCSLFSGEMKEGLLTWDHSLLRAEDSRSQCLHHRNLWTRK